jgi:hypothetical protein
MSLKASHKLLGWPEPSEIFNPSGAGPAVLAHLAKQKLQNAIRRFPGCDHSKVGVLIPKPQASATPSPLAVVVEFRRAATDGALREVHRLAWNFARSPLLITLDPVAIRAWSCCEPPQLGEGLFDSAEILDARLDLADHGARSEYVAHALSWLSLISGDFFRKPERARYFDRNNGADRLLLDNLKEVRAQLHKGNPHAGRTALDFPTIHALLARLMFLQFLADRRDAGGNAALSQDFFEQRRRDKTLSAEYSSFADVLISKADTYRLFRWLNEKFNGDLFPTEQEQQAEELVVDENHLEFLANFIRGDVQLKKGQRFLWALYSFDVIPLEFISSIYEEFVRNGDGEPGKGVVYTPAHLVDFILDEVLPWEGDRWDVSVLDPACGSGIFLVKAYQRLIHRWKVSHPGKRPSAAVLRYILERCLFGVDTEEDAVRVASFSLYLAMCDEIDPKRYWTTVRFPRLRGNTINCHDFFDDGPTIIHGGQQRLFDYVVGNPPWGQEDALSDSAAGWIERERRARPTADARSWGTSYESAGPLFLPRAADLLYPDGCVSLMQSSSVLLNEVGTARSFRKRLFTEYSVEEAVNLAPLRYILFSTASGASAPPCIITLRRKSEAVTNESFVYICPKPIRTVEDDYRMTVGPADVQAVNVKELLSGRNPLTPLLWGGRRDIALINKLAHLPTLRAMEETKKITSREGIIRGDRTKDQKKILNRKILERPNFPKGVFLVLDPQDLPTNTDPATHSRDSTNFDAFDHPQMLIKQSWVRENLRFRAVRVKDRGDKGVICTQAYVTVRSLTEDPSLLDAACLLYNSSFALYWLYLTNHRLASFIAEATVNDLLQLPLPSLQPSEPHLLEVADFATLDERVKHALNLDDTEWTLIDDFFVYTLPEFKQLPDAPGSKATTRDDHHDELLRYSDYFLKVLEAGFGNEERFAATIFREDRDNRLAVRLVGIHLKPLGVDRVRHEGIKSEVLSARLRALETALRKNDSAKGIAFERVARVYNDYPLGRARIPTIYLIKPDQARYWTASVAMRDADETFNDIILWEGYESRRKSLHSECL